MEVVDLIEKERDLTVELSEHAVETQVEPTPRESARDRGTTSVRAIPSLAKHRDHARLQ